MTRKRKVIACAVAGSIIASSTLIGIGLYKESIRERHENLYGYEDINPFLNIKVKDDDFVILPIGNHKNSKSYFINNKIKMCNKSDISLGIIIEPNTTLESDIYNDVELVKDLISSYNIDFPVYLDINKIIENKTTNKEIKIKLIKDFLDKCTSNGIYTGVYGTDTNLCRLYNECDIKDYDAFLVMDNNEIKYKGVYNIIKDLDGKIYSKENLALAIQNKKLNNKDNFVFDGKYTVSEGETLLDIALHFGISVNELLEFNNINEKDVITGTVLRIPCIVNTVIPDNNSDYKVLDNPLLGCDISYCQGKDIDWAKISRNYEFMIIRLSQGLNIDTCFENNTKNCKLNGIPYGIYCFNGFEGADYPDKNEYRKALEKQADFVVENLKNKVVDYPVYLDLETFGNTSFITRYSKEDIDIVLDVWREKITEAGYTPGIYCNKDTYFVIDSYIDIDLNDEFELWIAGSNDYNVRKELQDLNVLTNTYSYKDKNYSADILQVSEAVINSGAGNSEGCLDVNYSFKDYTKPVYYDYNENDELFKIKHFDPTPKSLPFILLGSSLGIAITSGIIIKKKKNKNKAKRYTK